MISLLANGTLFWSVAAIGLAGLVVYQVTDEQPPLPDIDAMPSEAAADLDLPEAAQIVALPSEDLIDAIAARPLFSPSRLPDRPETVARPEVDTRSDEKPTLELIGTLLVGDDHIALLKHPTDGLMKLRPGQEVEGWTIVDVQDRRVNLENEDRIEVLTLRKDRVGRPAARTPMKSNGHARKTNEEPDDEEREPSSAPIRRPI